MGHFKDTSVEVTLKGKKVRIAKSDLKTWEAKQGTKKKTAKSK